jgi:DNA (cytosine-5)-methyltransferase 1
MSKLYLIDLFCGAGGVSTGFEAARNEAHKVADVIACVNHDAIAIDSHFANHPSTLHFTEDIRTLDVSKLGTLTRKTRSKDPDGMICLWASLECTNFSKAKGGLPRDGDSRTLAESLFRYIDAIDPDYIFIENVEEFMSWGPLDENGKPVSKRSGTDYVRWCNKIQAHGYNFDWRILNAADFGAYTSRKRYFAIFSKSGLPIVFPEPTHAKNPQKEGMFGKLQKWKAVRDVLNLEDVGESIFTRKKPLSEKTMERIYAGLIKFVAGGKDAFLLKYNSVNKETGKHVPPDIDEPCPTIAVQPRLGLVQPVFTAAYYGNGHNCHDINSPSPTLRTKDCVNVVSTQYLVNYHHSSSTDSIDTVNPTLTTKDKLGLVSTQFINRDFTSGGFARSIDEPSGALMPFPKSNLVTCRHYLANPQWGVNGNGSVENPCPVIIARQDKSPLYLVTTEQGYLAIEIYETDSDFTKKIKEFMAMYGIIDINMRMLRVHELLKIMGFPDSYVLKGNQSDQKRFIGNAVEVNQAKVIAEALAKKLTSKIEITEAA